jgi:hypothetical protein
MPEQQLPTNPLAWAVAVPTGIAALVRGSVERAAANARAAAAVLDNQARERRALSPREGDSEQGAPGEVVRLPRPECLRLLGTRHFGRFAYVARAGTPDVVPVNYALTDGGEIVVMSGPGPKLQAADRGEVVAFEVDDIDESTHGGWSIVVAGRARRVAAHERAALTPLPDPWATGPRRHLIAITPTRIDGRRLC